MDTIRARLRDAGHDEASVSAITVEDKHVKKLKKGLSDAVWKKYQLYWASLASAAKVEATYRESLKMIPKYMEVDHFKTTKVEQLDILDRPGAWEIIQHPSIQAYVQEGRVFDEDDTEKIPEYLPHLAQRIILTKKARLEQEIHRNIQRVLFNAGRVDLSNTDLWNLATLVFTCDDAYHKKQKKTIVPLIGYRMIAIHAWMDNGSLLQDEKAPLCPNAPNEDHIHFNVAASYLASQLIKLAGLSPTRATISDMDELETRFSCLRCMQDETFMRGGARIFSGKRVYRHVFNWRYAIGHALCHHPQIIQRGEVYFKVIPGSPALEKARNFEEKDTAAEWFCNWCTDEGVKVRTTEDVWSHVYTLHYSHGNPFSDWDPVPGFDYITSHEDRLRWRYWLEPLNRNPDLYTVSRKSDYDEPVGLNGSRLNPTVLTLPPITTVPAQDLTLDLD